jgi:hypothetical protein
MDIIDIKNNKLIINKSIIIPIISIINHPRYIQKSSIKVRENHKIIHIQINIIISDISINSNLYK